MKPIAAITLGNSTAVLAVVAKGAVKRAYRIPIERLADMATDPAKSVIVASVNPPALKRLRRIARNAGAALLVAGEDFPIPMKTDVDRPERVGTDRLLESLAAYRRLGRECIVVDFGTAITVNAVRADGTFAGGAIFPGLAMMVRALSDGTALLPEIPPPSAAPLVGRNTEEAISVGVLRGAAGAVAGLIDAARQVVGGQAPVILTGGAAEAVADLLPADCRTIAPNLVIEGLLAAYDRWKNR